jgi:hypothetical protein
MKSALFFEAVNAINFKSQEKGTVNTCGRVETDFFLWDLALKTWLRNVQEFDWTLLLHRRIWTY